MPLCHRGDCEFDSRRDRHGFVAQSVEQRTENPCVGGSILPETTMKEGYTPFFFVCATSSIG